MLLREINRVNFVELLYSELVSSIINFATENAILNVKEN
jgi:hypothetical protein